MAKIFSLHPKKVLRWENDPDPGFTLSAFIALPLRPLHNPFSLLPSGMHWHGLSNPRPLLILNANLNSSRFAKGKSPYWNIHHITRFVLTLHPEFDMEKHLDRFGRTSRWRAPTAWLHLEGLQNISASYISAKIRPRKPQHHHLYQQKLRLFISVMAGSHICSKATALWQRTCFLPQGGVFSWHWWLDKRGNTITHTF